MDLTKMISALYSELEQIEQEILYLQRSCAGTKEILAPSADLRAPLGFAFASM